jgi:hypothetical protein
LSVTFSIESFEEIISETSVISNNSITASMSTQVDEPSSLAIILSLIVVVLLSRFHKSPNR